MTEYDFIIVGDGTAGCVLANRLSTAAREPWTIPAYLSRSVILGTGPAKGPYRHAVAFFNSTGTPDLKMCGIEGLRVIDASIMQTLINAHTNAAAFLIDERGADLILGRVQS